MTEKLIEFKNKCYCLSDAKDVFDVLETYDFSDDEMRSALSFIQDTMEQQVYNDASASERSVFNNKLFSLLCEYNYNDAKGYFISHINEKRDTESFVKLAKETKPNAKNYKKYIENLTYPKDILHDNCGINFVYDLVLKNIDPITQIDLIKELSYLTEEEIEKHYNIKIRYHFDHLQEREKVHLKLLYEKDPNLFIKTLTNYANKIESGDRVDLIDFGMRYVTGFRYSRRKQKFLDVDFNHIDKNDLLATLTRGELQNFIVSSNVDPKIKLELINSSRIELFKDDDTKSFFRDISSDMLHSYFSYLNYMKENFDFETKGRKDFNDEIDEEGKEYTELINSYNKLYEYELMNLRIILSEKNLSKRFKMLNEAINYEENEEAYKECEFDDSRQKFYFEFLENTIKEFYTSIGIDYDRVSINENCKARKIYYGIEIEESGYGGDDAVLVGHFSSHHDGSIFKVNKGSKALFDDDYSSRREYVNDVAWADDEEELELIKEQSRILSFLGARSNYSCGFHVHVSSDYTENADIDGLCKTISFPNDYDPEIDAQGISSEDKDYYEERYKLEGFEMPYSVTREIYDMQKILAVKFLAFFERIRDDGYASFLEYREEADIDTKYRFVNLRTLTEGTGVEFRFFNLPDYIDSKVIESYIDFSTSYFMYMEENNNTMEYVNEAIDEVFGDESDILSKEERADLAFDILLEELDLKDDTVKVIKNLDKIFEFYGTKEESTSLYSRQVEREEIDYYTDIDKSILEENESSENLYEEAVEL